MYGKLARKVSEVEKEKKTEQKKLDINDKYLQQLEDIKIRVPKGYREIIKNFAAAHGYGNVNQLVIGLINEKMAEKGYTESIPTGIREVKKENQE